MPVLCTESKSQYYLVLLCPMVAVIAFSHHRDGKLNNMCSILITNRAIVNFEQVNYYLQFRGPDYTSTHQQNGITFVHNLLSICGEFTPQPFIEDSLVAMHNGEIYNYGDYSSDGYAIIPAYQQHGDRFARQFDGEFAVALADFKRNVLIFATDIFATSCLIFGCCLIFGYLTTSSWSSTCSPSKFLQDHRRSSVIIGDHL